MATKRKGMSKKVRFEVFKRDSFKCQYCGRSAPDVLLHVDHIHPVAKGGASDILNLVTSCADCNGGKSDRELSDDSVLAKQRLQLQDANERLEQLKLMVAWRESMGAEKKVSVDAVGDAYSRACPGWSLTDTGRRNAAKYIRQHGLPAVLSAMDRAAEKMEIGKDGKATKDSGEGFFRLLYVFLQPPDVQQLYIVRALMRRRYNYLNERMAMDLLRSALAAGVAVDDLKAIVREETCWSGWKCAMESLLGER